ncbi:Gamma-aminobutyric acid (GABA) B receptor [Seminavis robusta]|uniref:Gamma-aminobutyric acid (GABA) B receptor n=1 Tax=Seminavis robusta TaxID=568900 RepID=A0A9N8EAG7_9STRA|nr:Gamma-aminobutyric acid (GABA) B receptor [Seminavis robusta]|eukprot:Sro883_g215450.1 Gamma-aminobutyric acid (GABA) B receptor (924) ;mRNA; f:11852-14820
MAKELIVLSAVLFMSTSSAAGNEITNPYHGGCLQALVPNWSVPRVCNSDDITSTGGGGSQHCRVPDMEYLEIRTYVANWESSVIVGWLVQIVLSEMLGVPATIEAGSYGEIKSFYDPLSRLDFITHNNATALEIANTMPQKDCRLADKTKDNYQPCAHFLAEAWDTDSPWVRDLIDERKIDAQVLGVLGLESWFVTKFTSQQDPTIVSYHGLIGEPNRHKLAAMFKRPTTWAHYCQQISTNNCTIPDQVAQRPPHNELEEQFYFAPDNYTGHFRFTDQNNCTLHPDSCTGHIANYPCGWSGHMEQVLYHLNIAMESNGPEPHKGGYSYSQLVQLWRAANATKSNLMMMWWTPEPLYQEFFFTDSAMQRVMLPPATQQCLDAHPTFEQECDPDPAVRVGSPDGACDHNPINLHKLLGSSLHDISMAADEANRNPAQEMLRDFQLTELQLGEIFELWQTESTPQDAVCKWAANNLDVLNATVPPSYPRVLQVENEYSFMFALVVAMGSLATILVVLTTAMVYRFRHRASIRHAQPGFLWLLLWGCLLVAIGAILRGVPATHGTCIASTWFVNIGYNFELVPLIVKVGAINRMMVAATKMRRITLSIASLYQAVAMICMCCVLYLFVWTGLDPPLKESEYALTELTTDAGERIVSVSHFCGTSSSVWQYVSVGWNAVLLLCASVLAFQSRNVSASFNESRTLAFLSYSHFMFVCLRCATYLLKDQLNGTTTDSIQSLLYSVDTIAAVFIYFLPKLRVAETSMRGSMVNGSTNYMDKSFVRQWMAMASQTGTGAFEAASSFMTIMNHETEVRNGRGSATMASMNSAVALNVSQAELAMNEEDGINSTNHGCANPEEAAVANFKMNDPDDSDSEIEISFHVEDNNPTTISIICPRCQESDNTGSVSTRKRASWSQPSMKKLLSDSLID